MKPLGLVLLLAALAAAEERPLHPRFPLLDTNDRDVLETGAPVSPEKTCGRCHDSGYIATHSYHVTADTDPRGARHVGGGRASRDMNCFLCHLSGADNDARVAELRAGRFDRAATATLAATGIVKRDGTYDKTRFRDGLVDLVPRDPPDRNCGFCHGPVHAGPEPFAFRPGDVSARGMVFSAQRLKESAMNLAGKESLAHAWDVHAERLVRCAACHHAPNNPVYRTGGDQPAHLTFDARRVSFDAYLKQPSHDRGTIRQCADCHRTEGTHEWLPYRERHMARVRCEACHIPRVYAPALREIDRTGQRLRGIDGPVGDPRSLVTGWKPALLPDEDGRLAPFNLVVESGRVGAYRLNHNVVPGAYAIRDCAECHARDSQRMEPGTAAGFYLLGRDRSAWIDGLGVAVTLLVLAGVLAHAAMRVWAARRRR